MFSIEIPSLCLYKTVQCGEPCYSYARLRQSRIMISCTTWSESKHGSKVCSTLFTIAWRGYSLAQVGLGLKGRPRLGWSFRCPASGVYEHGDTAEAK